MKKEDFERLKVVCEKEGFEIEIFGIHNEILKITPKDIWDGVEFVSLVKCAHGFVYKVIEQKDNEICIIANGNQWFNKCMFVPSTESAYIDQLKKEAHERFGEIKDGDRFNRYGLGRPDQSMIGVIGDWSSPKGFRYYKDEDYLSFNGTMIYRQGKWAERVKERLSGEYVRYHILWPKEDGSTLGYSFKGFANKEGVLPIDKLEDAGKFLAKQLESYLNLEKHEIIGYGDVISIHLKVGNNKTHNFERIKEAVIKFAEELKKNLNGENDQTITITESVSFPKYYKG